MGGYIRSVRFICSDTEFNATVIDTPQIGASLSYNGEVFKVFDVHLCLEENFVPGHDPRQTSLRVYIERL